jgi:type II secretion system protein G
MPKRGFTLIELLVVIGIIGLLSMVITVAFGNARLKARDAKRMSDLKQVQTALELYYTDQGRYPTAPANGLIGDANSACLNDIGWQQVGCPNAYMSRVPADPNNSAATPLYFGYTKTTSTYAVTGRLEGQVNGISGNILLSPSGIQAAP